MNWTAEQESKFAQINDSYGVASWQQQGETVHLECEDGDEVDIQPDGSAVWTSGAYAGTEVDL